MNESLKNEQNVREYLLGKVSDETLRAEFEELLFLDEDFCSLAEIMEDALINDFVFGRLNEKDLQDFLETLENNGERREKIALTKAVKEKAQTQRVAEKETKPSFFESLKAFFQKPLNVGAFAVLLVGVLILSFFVWRMPHMNEVAELKMIYQKERPTETRISGFDYAPLNVIRGENKDETNKNKLKIEELKFRQAVETNPTAENHHALGVFHLTQQNYRDTLDELEKAVKLDDKNAKFYNDLGSAYFEFAKNGEKDKRLENLARANEAFSKAVELDANLLEALFNKALALQELNLPREARGYWELYLQKDSTSKWADEARKNLEKIAQMQSGSKTKEQILDDFINAYRNKDENMIWKIHTQTKGMFTGISPTEQLTRRYLEAEKQNDKAQSKESIEALTSIGKLEKEKHADFFFAELANYYSKVDESKIDDLLKSKDLLAEGKDLVSQGKYTESIGKYEESKALFQKAGNEFEVNLAELWIAQMLPDVGKIDESRNRLTALTDRAEKKNFKILLPTAYYWQSIADFRQKLFSQSLKTSKLALKKAVETANDFEIQHCAEMVAGIYLLLGENDRASNFLGLLFQPKDIYYENSRQTWRNNITISDLLESLEHNFTTVDFAREQVKLSKEILPETDAVNFSLSKLTKALRRKNRFEEALTVADESNEIVLKRERLAENNKAIADTFLSRADLKSEMQNCNEALVDYEKSLEFYAKIPQMTHSLYNVHKGKLLCLQKLNKQDEFQNEQTTVLNLSEEYRQNIREDSSRQGFFDDEQIVFDAAIGNALSQNDSRKAFEFVETSKARSLLDFVKSEKSIAEVEKDFTSVAKPLSIEEIQTRLPDSLQIVEYAVLEDKLAIWIISKKRFELIEKQISTDEFEKKISDYRKMIVGKEAAESIKTTASELYEILLPKNLEKDKTLCLIPDKSLHQIPFASLISPEGKYLIEDFAVFYSPSASVLVFTSENANQKEKDESLLSIGNPSFDREENPNLHDLPQAEIEAKEIVKSYSKSNKFVGEDATKESFLSNLETAEVIHFAGHFIMNGQSPSNSKLLFSGEDLRSFELAEKKPSRSKLVVLSACETGFERFNKSEGAIGIARTFLAMGTPLVVASSWKVDSEATKDLMISFHRKRRLGNLSSIEALRQTQLEMLKTPGVSSPFYWSAFSATGGFAKY